MERDRNMYLSIWLITSIKSKCCFWEKKNPQFCILFRFSLQQVNGTNLPDKDWKTILPEISWADLKMRVLIHYNLHWPFNASYRQRCSNWSTEQHLDRANVPDTLTTLSFIIGLCQLQSKCFDKVRGFIICCCTAGSSLKQTKMEEIPPQ